MATHLGRDQAGASAPQGAGGAASVTLEDVAREAGVSLATASRVLNGGLRRPGAAMQQRVTAAADRLGYSVSAPAQAMARGRTNIVGLIVHDIADPYFAGIAAGAMAAASSHRLLTTMADTRRNPELEITYVAALRQQRAQAIILAGSRVRDRRLLDRLAAELRRYRAGGGRVAVIGQQRLDVDTVVVDNRPGARALAVALVDAGHDRFAVIAGPSSLLTSADRVAGFREGLTRRGIDVASVPTLHEEFTREGGYRGATRWLADRDGYACLFAVTDVMAVGALAAIREADLHPPHDLALAGFDDVVTSRDVFPALTTVHIPLEQIGRDAVELVLRGGADGRHSDVDLRTIHVPGSVVLRESTLRPT